MFSFHKPKVYRSSTGCCICKAKSSSSRFTDSKKYEEDFVECFQLPEKRCGEVCNACVLLVKRWKKLPEGNGRNWRHVVDARAKTFSKVKSRVSIRATPKRKSVDEDQFDQLLRKKKPRKLQIRNSCDDLQGEEGSEESPDGSRSPSPSLDADEPLPVNSKRLPRIPQISGFIDLKIWKMEKICCGTIFVGPGDSIIVDPRLVVPCKRRTSGLKCSSPLPPPIIKAPLASSVAASNPSASSKTYTTSDNSSDSGYDESSNQSAESTLPRPILAAAN